MLEKREKKYRRHRRIKAKIFGTVDRPRLCVFRSAKHIYAQLIDDEKGKTLVAASDLDLGGQRKKTKKILSIKDKNGEQKKMTRKLTIAFEVGELLAERAKKEKIEKVIFDRGGFAYHGRVKALAEGARNRDLKF